MGYLIFRGASTNNLPNVYVSQMPDHRKARLRYTEYYVKGRDGALHVNEGYANYDLKVVLVMVNASAETRQLVNAWADGTGKLITSDDLTLAYNATVTDEVKWSRVKAATVVDDFDAAKTYGVGDFVKYDGTVYQFTANHNGAWSAGDVTPIYYLINGFFDTATITFNCQPFMVEATDSEITMTGTGTVNNPGSAVAFPKIQVNGAGDVTFTFSGQEIAIDGMTYGVPVFIDCENGYVYTEEGATTMRGEIPMLEIGTNTIIFGENLTSLVITPHWRWI